MSPEEFRRRRQAFTRTGPFVDDVCAEYSGLPVSVAAESIAFRDQLTDAAIWAWLDGDGAA